MLLRLRECNILNTTSENNFSNEFACLFLVKDVFVDSSFLTMTRVFSQSAQMWYWQHAQVTHPSFVSFLCKSPPHCSCIYLSSVSFLCFLCSRTVFSVFKTFEWHTHHSHLFWCFHSKKFWGLQSGALIIQAPITHWSRDINMWHNGLLLYLFLWASQGFVCPDKGQNLNGKCLDLLPCYKAWETR